MKNRYAFYFLLLLLGGCNGLDKKIPDANRLLEEELKKIDWTQVDAYPSVDLCDSLLDEQQRKECFFEFLTLQLQEKLNLDTLSSVAMKTDTISVRVTVYPDAHLEFEPFNIKDSLAFKAAEIDSLIQLRLRDFPDINPAIKRGVPVKTQFVLPIVLKSE